MKKAKKDKEQETESPTAAGPRLGGSSAREARREGNGLVNGAISRRIEFTDCADLDTDNLPDWILKTLAFEQRHGAHGTVIVTQNGLRAKQTGFRGRVPKGGDSIRGDVKGFSDSARRRMIDFLLGLDWEILKASNKRARSARGLFATLTYPESYPDSWDKWKTHLDAFRKRLLRSWGEDIGVIWKLENQESRCLKYGGEFIPHFHLAIDFRRIVSVRDFREWLSRSWYEIVGSNDIKHLHAGTNARPIYGDTGKLFSYLTKYLSKTFQTTIQTGRVWGVWNSFEKCSVKVYTNVQWVQLLRLVRKWGKHSKYLRHLYKTLGFRLYGKNLDQLLLADRKDILP